jgi:hypothetical protein
MKECNSLKKFMAKNKMDSSKIKLHDEEEERHEGGYERDLESEISGKGDRFMEPDEEEPKVEHGKSRAKRREW